MKVYVKKTVHMCFSKKRTQQFQTNYNINGTQLLSVHEFKYLGVFFTPDLSWTRHIDYVIAKSSRVLGYLKRNAKQFPVKARALLYLSNVRSVLEYASTVWDPWTQINRDKLERIQSKAVRFVFQNYSRQFSVSEAKNLIGWDSLQKRRCTQKLKLFHDIYHSRTGIDRTKYLHDPDYVSKRVDHDLKVKEISCKSAMYSKSFFPNTIRAWNRLTAHIVSISTNAAFVQALRDVIV
uniref:Sphingosine kinase n=1 Tax=Rhipicephalus appendiculatus TaxID=34631 RepID=A0A131YM36_RHIAP